VRHETAVLRLAGGDGCACLLREDVARGAVLPGSRRSWSDGSSGRAHDDERAVHIYLDVHAWNACRAPCGERQARRPRRPGAEPGYNLRVVTREDPEECLTGDPSCWLRRLVLRDGVDAVAV
jgi:hypothetical protein